MLSHSTIVRGVIYLVMVLGTICCDSVTLRGADQEAPGGGEGTPPKAVAKEIQSRLQERRDLLRTVVRRCLENASVGLDLDLETALRGAEALVETELSLAGTPTEKQAAHQSHLDNLKKIHEIVKDREAAGVHYTKGKLIYAEGARRHAEIRLLRSKQPAGDLDTPEVRALLKKWQATIIEEKKVREMREKEGADLHLEDWAGALSSRLLEAELAQAKNQADRVAAHQSHLDRMKELEKVCLETIKAGVKGMQEDLLIIKARRLTAEALLLQAKAPSSDKISTKLQELYKQRCEALRQAFHIMEETQELPRSIPLDMHRFLCDAELAVAMTEAEQRVAFQRYLKRLQDEEKLIKGRVEAGVRGYQIQHYAAAKAARLEAEVLLLQAQAESK